MAKPRKSWPAEKKFQKYLPEDLLLFILLLIPVKSLVRLRCVCKLWYEIISSNSFINKRLKTSSIRFKYLIFEYCKSWAESYSVRLEQSTIYTYKSEQVRNYRYRPDLMVYGICNGLLCLSNVCLRRVFLWNPVIRKVKNIPNYAPTSLHVAADLCLGYCDDDYKLIKICGTYKNIYNVAVYSLRTDSWESTTSDGRTDLLIRSLSSRFVNGVAYFGFVGQIVSFDLVGKRIQEIKYPQTFSRTRSFHNQIGNNKMEAYGNSVVLMEVDSSYFSMWVLRNSDVLSSSWWEKKLLINTQSIGECCPLGFIENDEYVLKTRKEQIYSYKLESSEVNNLSFELNLKDMIHVNPFVESLVLIDENTKGTFVGMVICAPETDSH